MTIDPLVQQAAHAFGVDPALIQAVVTAEGGLQALVRAVQCSMPDVQTVDLALRVTCRSAAHAMSDFVKTRAATDFVTFWAARWAPRGAANDPTGLNANWPRNVLTRWTSTTDV